MRKPLSNRRTLRFTDHTGERWARLLCLGFEGRHEKTGTQYWRYLCDCGREVVRPRDLRIKSCGCAKEEMDRKRDFRTLREDGRFRLNKSQELVLPDGRRVESIHALARLAGISKRAACNRVANWPPERWLEPGMGRG